MIAWRVFDVTNGLTDGRRKWLSTLTAPNIFVAYYAASRMFPRRVLQCDGVDVPPAVCPRYQVVGFPADGAQRWLVFYSTACKPGHPDFFEALVGEVVAPTKDHALALARLRIPVPAGMLFSRVQSLASFLAA